MMTMIMQFNDYEAIYTTVFNTEPSSYVTHSFKIVFNSMPTTFRIHWAGNNRSQGCSNPRISTLDDPYNVTYI